VCVNSWGTCTDSNCHMVHWSLDDTTKLITFNITADLENNQWVGLGFSDKKQMVRTLFIYILPS
jgi:positive regulator of sigma E activity